MDTIMTIPGQVVIWQFGGKSGNLRSQNQYSTDNGGNGYNMLCKTNNQYLTYKDTSVGISLDFTTNSSLRKAHFRLPDGVERDILTGEKVAFGVGGGDAFLRYTNRTIGINLDWFGDPQGSSDPSFQWRIYGGTTEIGKSIGIGSWVALLNENVEPTADFLVELDRVGGDIGWTGSPDWSGWFDGWLTQLDSLVEFLIE